MRALISIVLCLALCSCGTGRIYTHTITPLTVDLRETAVGDRTAAQDIKRVDYYVQSQWNSNAIGEIAKKHGITEVLYADFETLSVAGVWTQYHVHIYGR